MPFANCFSRPIRAVRLTARRFARNTRGVAAIEMAFIFPFMVVLLIGLVDVTNLISANRRVTLAASTIGDLVTQVSSGTVTAANIDGFFNAVQPIIEPFDTNDVKVEVFGYRRNGAAVNLIWQRNRGGSCGGTPSTAGYLNLMTDANDLVTARVCIEITPLFSYVLGNTIFNPEHAITLRPRETRLLDCTGC